MTPGNRADPAVERGDAGKDVVSGLHQGFEDRNEFRRDRQLASDDFLGPSFKAANPLSEHHAKGLQQAPDLVLQLDAHADQGLTRRQQRPVDIGIVAFDLHGFEPARAHDLGEAPGIMTVCLVRHHFQHAARMARVEANEGNLARR